MCRSPRADRARSGSDSWPRCRAGSPMPAATGSAQCAAAAPYARFGHATFLQPLQKLGAVCEDTNRIALIMPHWARRCSCNVVTEITELLTRNRTMQSKGFSAVRRDYGPADVERLAGSFRIRHTLAEMGAERLRHLLNTEPFVPTLGPLTGNQAVQQVKAGLKAIYLSGWQVAADANTAGQMYPDQSLYPVDSVPNVVRRINNALRRGDQIAHSEGDGDDTYWMAPIIADAEAGFGGALNAYELMKAMIEAGAAGVHFEDQLASEKKCGHLGGKVLVPTQAFIRTLNAARLAADVCGVPTILLARTDAHSATLITSDIDERDHPFIDRANRTAEGFFRLKQGSAHSVEHAIARGT